MDYLHRIYLARYFWWHLAMSDIRAKWRRSVFGVFWTMIQPLGMTALLAFVLSRLFNNDIMHYAPYILSGVIVWEFVTTSLVVGANLPEPMKQQRGGGWSGDARTDALNLLEYAMSHGVNPIDRRFTVLGSILEPQLELFGFNDLSTVVALIERYALIRDNGLRDSLAIRFQIPKAIPAGVQVDNGPAFEWHGPDPDVELQSWFAHEPDLLDVGFMEVS